MVRPDSASRSPLRDLPWLLGRVADAAPLPLLAWTLLTGFRAALVAGNLWATTGAVDALARARTGLTAATGPWLMFAATRLADPLESYVREALSFAAGRDLREAAQEKTLRLPLHAFDREETHDLIRRAADGADARGPALVGETLGLLRQFPEVAVNAVAVAMIARWLPAVLATLAALLVWRLMRAGSRVRTLDVERTHDRRLADYYASLITGRAHAAEVRVFGLGDEILARWRTVLSRYLGDRLRLLLRNSVEGNAAYAAGLAGALLALAVLRHHVDPGAAARAFTAMGGVSNGLARIAFGGREFVDHAGYACDLRTLLDGLPDEAGAAASPPPIRAASVRPVQPACATDFPHPLRQGLVLEGVSYRYPAASANALTDVSVEIGAGEMVALVGPNGAGKSTLAALLLGLYRPATGAGRRPRSGGRAISAVLQEFGRYTLPVRDNVGFGDLARLADGAAPGGVASGGGTEAWLGPEFDGRDLSGGEWLRVAIARGCCPSRG